MKRRGGLGRGLDALLPSDGEDERQGSGLLEVELDRIDPNPNQPRKEFEGEPLRELAESIKTLGVLQPLLVRPKGGDRFELIAGERRLRASRLAGMEVAPVLVVETDERGSLERAIVENIHRENLNPIEEAAAYRQLIDEGGLTQEELGGQLGKNRVTVSNTLRLLDLPTSVQQLLAAGRLTAGHGKALLALDGNPLQERLAKRASQEGMSVRETEELARKFQMMGGGPVRAETDRTAPAVASAAQRRLSDYLQTRVRIEMGKRKGKIVVDFVSLEELERILRTMVGEAEGGTFRSVELD